VFLFREKIKNKSINLDLQLNLCYVKQGLAVGSQISSNMQFHEFHYLALKKISVGSVSEENQYMQH